MLRSARYASVDSASCASSSAYSGGLQLPDIQHMTYCIQVHCQSKKHGEVYVRIILQPRQALIAGKYCLFCGERLA